MFDLTKNLCQYLAKREASSIVVQLRRRFSRDDQGCTDWKEILTSSMKAREEHFIFSITSFVQQHQFGSLLVLSEVDSGRVHPVRPADVVRTPLPIKPLLRRAYFSLPEILRSTYYIYRRSRHSCHRTAYLRNRTFLHLRNRHSKPMSH